MSNRMLYLIFILVISFSTRLHALYSSGSSVVQLSESNFKSTLKGSGLWLVEFYAPWCVHCKAFAPEWEKVADALKGIVGIAAVDTDENTSLGSRYAPKGVPTIKLFYTDVAGKLKSSDYQGGRTATDIVKFATGRAKSLEMKRVQKEPFKTQAKSRSTDGDSTSPNEFYSGTDVITLTVSNFENEVLRSNDPWFVEFYAPWCGHCKKLQPEWVESAEKLKGKVSMGAVDCTVHQSICNLYSIKGYPSIKYFGSNKRKPEDYQNGRDSISIVQFGLARYSVNIPPPEVKELISQDVFDESCNASQALCFVAFLPNNLDLQDTGRARYMNSLKSLAETYKGRPFSYFWAQGAVHKDLEQTFGLREYPALVALNPKDKKYSVARSAFEWAHLEEFVEFILSADEAMSVVQGELAAEPILFANDGEVKGDGEPSFEV